jgi:hypothetical protein
MANVNFKGFKLNLTALFIQEAKNLISAYKSLLTRRIGTRGDQAPPNKPSTIKRKGKSHWMVDTGNTKNKGFLSEVTRKTLTIFASKQRHKNRSDVSYEKLFLLHNTARGRYSGVFGQAPRGSKIFQRVDKEINKQVQRFIEKRLPKRIIVRVKK